MATFTNLSTAADGTDATSYNTASISPSAGKVVLVAVGNMRVGTVTTPTLSGASTTWTQVATDNQDNFTRCTLFRGVAAGTGALTIDFAGNTQLRCAWSIVELSSVDTGGTNGANAIVQSATDNTENTTLTVTLGAFSSLSNATFGAVVVNASSPDITAGSGFTQIAETAVETIGIQTQYKLTNDTSVDWTHNESNDIVGIAAEIKSLDSSSGIFLTF